MTPNISFAFFSKIQYLARQGAHHTHVVVQYPQNSPAVLEKKKANTRGAPVLGGCCAIRLHDISLLCPSRTTFRGRLRQTCFVARAQELPLEHAAYVHLSQSSPRKVWSILELITTCHHHLRPVGILLTGILAGVIVVVLVDCYGSIG